MSYATVDEFMRRMKIAAPSADQLEVGQQVLDAAAGEIDSYLGYPPLPTDLNDNQSALLVTVNIDRAAEHWRLTPFGALGQGSDLPPVLTARDSWNRHARKLSSLKHVWGVA